MADLVHDDGRRDFDASARTAIVHERDLSVLIPDVRLSAEVRLVVVRDVDDDPALGARPRFGTRFERTD